VGGCGDDQHHYNSLVPWDDGCHGTLVRLS
jgi:hypothetical protein